MTISPEVLLVVGFLNFLLLVAVFAAGCWIGSEIKHWIAKRVYKDLRESLMSRLKGDEAMNEIFPPTGNWSPELREKAGADMADAEQMSDLEKYREAKSRQVADNKKKIGEHAIKQGT